MQPSTSGNMTSLVVWVFVIGLFVFRMSRPQRFTRMRFLLTPVLLLLVTAASIWGNAMMAAELGVASAAPLQVALALVLGALAGIPLGLIRGRHSEVKPTEKPGVVFVHSSPVIVLLWLGAFALRALIRYLMPHSGAMTAVVGDGLLAFSVSALVASYAIIYQRFKTLACSAPAVAV